MFYRKRFDDIERKLDKLEVYLIVNDPNTPNSAEAYDGLRKTLIQARKGAQSHMAHLAQLHRAASAAEALEPVLAKLRECMEQIGVAEIDDPTSINLDPTHPSFTEFFDLAGDGGGNLVVDDSAYIAASEDGSLTVVSRGSAHFESNGKREGVVGRADVSSDQASESLQPDTTAAPSGDLGEPDSDSTEGEPS